VKAVLRRFFLPDRAVLHWRPYAVVALGALALGSVAGSLSLTQRLEWALYDRMMTAATRNPAQTRRHRHRGDRRNPRSANSECSGPGRAGVHAALVSALVRGGARTIVLDLLFDEPSTDEDDTALSEAIREAGNVVLASDRALTTDRAYKIEQWVGAAPDLCRRCRRGGGSQRRARPRRCHPQAAVGD
jgi:CHASE2 domain-containing sensor protein